jgi:hypothetical protein
MKASIVLYTGPSMLDDQPIVVLATLGSKNEKTGPMVQTWILRSDMSPIEASKALADESICGSCPRRQSTGGDCYVLIHNAPQSAYKAWVRRGKASGDVEVSALAIARDAAAHGIRLGSYGDPAAVPFQVWQTLIARVEALTGRSVKHTGYTHQWRAVAFTGSTSYEHHAWCRKNLMASVDSVRESVLARAAGYRYFLAIPAADVSGIPGATVECLATRQGSMATCQTCGICDGAQGRAARASVYLVEHGARSGAKAKRSAALRVV